MNPVLKSIKPVIEKSRFVKINKENLLKFCSNFELGEKPFWLNALPFDFLNLKDKEKLNFIFVASSLNFCFWGLQPTHHPPAEGGPLPKWKIEYKGNFYDGAWGLLAALTRAIEKGFPILNWEYLANIPENDLREIFKGNVQIPLFKERLDILRENGKIMLEKFGGDFENLIKKGKKDALKLLNLITKNFSSFNDFAIYQNHQVFFHKKPNF